MVGQAVNSQSVTANHLLVVHSWHWSADLSSYLSDWPV